MLYYIDSFAIAGRNGIRFEHGAAVPPAPARGEYPFCYRYALAPRSGSFADWQQGRTLAPFDWTDLGAFASAKRPAQVWLALARRQDEVVKPARAPDAPFAVRVQIRPPHRRQPHMNSETRTRRRVRLRFPSGVRTCSPHRIFANRSLIIHLYGAAPLLVQAGPRTMLDRPQ